MLEDLESWWERLLTYIEEQHVVPVVGPELLTVRANGGEMLLDRYLARELVYQLKIDSSRLAPDYNLNEVAVEYQRMGRDRSSIYIKVYNVLKQTQLEPPAALVKLARITDFRIFLSTTFDNLVTVALNKARFEGRPDTEMYAFSLTNRRDIHTSNLSGSRPVVFQLFGKVSGSADYAVTEEDTLEFIHNLRDNKEQLPNLYDLFRDHHLLLIGCSYSNWLTRFFLRALSPQRLLDFQRRPEFIADDQSAKHEGLVLFLEQCRAMVYPAGGAVAFVEELSKRWQERCGSRTSDIDVAISKNEIAEFPEGKFIFLSYASEDRVSMLALAEALKAENLNVWYDKERLELGDTWDHKLKSAVNKCMLFVPLLSRNSARQESRYLRKEWSWALNRNEMYTATGLPYIAPVILDDLPHGATFVPDEFWDHQTARMIDGEKVVVDALRNAFRKAQIPLAPAV